MSNEGMVDEARFIFSFFFLKNDSQLTETKPTKRRHRSKEWVEEEVYCIKFQCAGVVQRGERNKTAGFRVCGKL